MEAEHTLDPKKLTEELEKMTEWAKAVIFTQKQIIATKGCKPKFEELVPYFKAYESRDETVGRGFILMGEHYDVHRYHPPLVYGRRGNAQTGEGISLAVGKSRKGEKVYILITYILPIISARAVPQQINFYNDFSKCEVIQLESQSSLTDLKDEKLSIIIFEVQKYKNYYVNKRFQNMKLTMPKAIIWTIFVSKSISFLPDLSLKKKYLNFKSLF